jgi:hypothetical protein
MGKCKFWCQHRSWSHQKLQVKVNQKMKSSEDHLISANSDDDETAEDVKEHSILLTTIIYLAKDLKEQKNFIQTVILMIMTFVLLYYLYFPDLGEYSKSRLRFWSLLDLNKHISNENNGTVLHSCFHQCPLKFKTLQHRL